MIRKRSVEMDERAVGPVSVCALQPAQSASTGPVLHRSEWKRGGQGEGVQSAESREQRAENQSEDTCWVTGE